jgi:hypothetical protein
MKLWPASFQATGIPNLLGELAVKALPRVEVGALELLARCEGQPGPLDVVKETGL